MEPRGPLRRLSESSENQDNHRILRKRKLSSVSSADSDDDDVVLRASSRTQQNKHRTRQQIEDDSESSAPKRRSKARSTRRIQETNSDDSLEHDSDIGSSVEESESDEEEQDVIEKIFGKRVTSDSSHGPVEQFLVKFKDVAYVHCAWKSRDELETCPANIKRIQKYLQNEDAAASDDEEFENDDEPNRLSGSGRYFPPEYCQIDRIISHRIVKGTTPNLSQLIEGKYWDRCEFLVRWQQQGYDEATWEPYEVIHNLGDESDIRSEVQRYFRFCEPRNIRHSSKAANRKRSNNRTSAASLAWKAQSFPMLEFSNGLALRDYQIDGVKWMSFNWSQNRNSILADEMGLGKTVQISAFVHHLSTNEGVRGPFLVVAPLSTLQHWRRESEAWACSLNCLVYHGGAAAREVIRTFEFKYDRKYPEKPYKFDVFVTSYEMVLADARIMSRIHWDLVVVDESHRLKNRDSKLFRELSRFRYKHCVMLTGTPVQNSIEELWVLLHFIDPEVFDSIEEFQEQFGDLKRKEDVDALHSLLRPYFLRRMKADVEKDLPDRQEIVIDVEMTMLQKRLYKAIYDKNTEFLFRKASMPSLMNIGMQLRKCCNHPYLIRGVEEEQASGSLTDDQKMDLLVSASGKFVLMDKLLPKLRKEGHRVLIFSQMVRMLDIIEDYLNFRDFSYERIDGNIRGGDRQQAIDNFTKNSDIFVFMLATRAGGVGINLTAADTVIIFDSDWNPQNDLQAQARCHRIGQTQHVKVYRLITKNTYEQAMFNRASLKLGLDQAVLHPMTTNTKGNMEKLTKKDIENLLKNGAYSIVEEKSDERSKEFCEKDIDDILASNSRLIQYSSNPTMAGSSFAKASFVITSENGEEPLDIDDPNFWEKVGFHYEPEKADDLIVYESRKRRRVQRLNSYSGLDGNGQGKKEVTQDKDDAPYTHEEAEETTSDDEESDTAEKKLEFRRETVQIQEIVAEGDWSLRDRERFVRHVCGFGYDRWNPIRERINAEENIVHAQVHTAIMSRSVDDLRLAALCLIAACLAFDNSTATKRTSPSPIRNLLTFPTLAHDLQNVLKTQGAEWELPNRALRAIDQRSQMESGFSLLQLLPSFKDPRFELSLKRQGKNYLHFLERAYVLAFSVEQVCGPDMNFLLLAECAHYKLNAASEPNWTIADDAALLKGSYQFGQGDFESINRDRDSCLYGRLFYIPDVGCKTEDKMDGTAPVQLPRFPSLKSLMTRQRALLTNLGKQVSKITSRAAPAPAPTSSQGVRPRSSPVPAPVSQQAASIDGAPNAVTEKPDVIAPSIDPISAANQALQPIVIAPAYPPIVAETPSAAEIIGRAVEQVYASQIASPIPLQFVAEYRSLSTTAEEVLRAFPNQLMNVLHKSHYLNLEFETKEKEARTLISAYPTLKGPVEALGDNARDLSVLFRRIRRRSNKILHIQQMMSNWSAANSSGSDPKNILADAVLPSELVEKRKAEMDLFARITECLDAVTRLSNRNRLILSRLEHLASSRD